MKGKGKEAIEDGKGVHCRPREKPRNEGASKSYMENRNPLAG